MRVQGKHMVRGSLYKLQFINKLVCHTTFTEVFGYLQDKLVLFLCEVYYNDNGCGGYEKLRRTYRFVVDGQMLDLPGDDFDVYMLAEDEI